MARTWCMRFSRSTISKRRKKLLELAWNIGCTSVLATTPENKYYLSGYWGEGFLLVDYSESYLIVPKLEFERASAVAVDVKVIEAERGSVMYEKLAWATKGHIVCVDSPSTDVFFKISESTKHVKRSSHIFYEARIIKDEEEIARLLKGGATMDHVFLKAAEAIRPGVTERSVMAEIISEIVRLGGDIAIFATTISPIIVASGPNSAYPHAEPTDRTIRSGDFVVVDIVLRYEGYIVDATRTFHVGKTTGKEAKVYDAVLKAQEEGLKALSLGKTFDDIDKACRSYLTNSGLARHFVHSTGHGIGLEIHEPPWVGPGRKERLRRGMAFTIEPGVYIQGKFGIRIEDSVVMLDRPLILTKYSKALKEV